MTGASRRAAPRADAMLESLRGLGYTAASALADIVDNSISAGASNVDIWLSWEGMASRVSILDDGRGMSDLELERAMRLGDRSPLDPRAVLLAVGPHQARREAAGLVDVRRRGAGLRRFPRAIGRQALWNASLVGRLGPHGHRGLHARRLRRPHR
jgi:hypothetical protein